MTTNVSVGGTTDITVTTGNQLVFKNIATDSGTVVGDTAVDTLTITGAGGITTAGNDTNDTVTITQGAPDISSNSIGNLSDVDVTTSAPTANQILLWNGSNFVPGNVSSGAGYQSTNLLSDLDDVTLSSTSEGQILVYDASAPTQFVNRSLSGAISIDGDGVTAINSDQVGTTQLDLDNIDISDFSNITANVNVLNDKYIFNAHGNIGIGFFDSKLQLSTTELAGDLTVSSGVDIGTSGVRVDNIFVNNLNASGTITGIDTDDVGEGSSNQYFTNARADARITAASINDLADVDTTGVANGNILKYNSTSGNFEVGTDQEDLSNNDTDDLSEGSTNLYFTNARADARVNLQTGTNLDLSNKSTSDLAEGTNLYYTDSRFDTRLGTKTTDNLTEGSTNLYYTDTRARAVSIENVSEDTTPELGGTLDILGNDIKSSTANVVISADATDKDVILKIKDAGGTLQTAAEFRDYSFTENATDGDPNTAATVYRPVMDIDHGMRIGSSSANFSSTGNAGNNNTADYNQRGILITNGDDPYWPTVQITSYGGNNPLLDANGSSWAGGLGTRYSSAAVTLAGAGGTESSTTALTSGMRLGQFGFTGHDGDGFGGKGAIASASITVEANEDFESQSIVTIAGTSLGGATPDNDATITVTSVGGSGDITGITVSGTAAGSSVTEYTNVSGTTTTLPGSGATFDIQDDGDGTYSLTDGSGSAGDGINTAGSGYTSGNGRGARMVFDCLPSGETDVGNADSTNDRVIGIKFDGSEVHINPGRSLPGLGDTRFDCDFKVRGSSNDDILKVDAGTEIVSTGGVFQLYSASSDPSSNLANGQMYYNTTTHKFRGYANGAWTDLH